MNIHGGNQQFTGVNKELAVGDIYEHRQGGYWLLMSFRGSGLLQSKRLNDSEIQAHREEDVDTIYKKEQTV